MKYALLAVVLLVAVTALCCPSSGEEPPTPSGTALFTAEPGGAATTREPGLLTVAEIERQKEGMTDLQWETYRQEIVGEPIAFAGEIVEVYDDGRVQIDEGARLTTYCMLYDIPLDVAVELRKDQFVQGQGTVQEIGTILGLSVDIAVETLE
jgi:hypothetical protein